MQQLSKCRMIALAVFCVIVVIGVAGVPSTVSAGKHKNKVEICHQTRKGGARVLSVRGNKVGAHLAHGDYIVSPEVCEFGATPLDNDCDGQVDEGLYCDLDLSITRQVNTPARIAETGDGRFFVTDPEVGAVFIYDPELNLSGMIKNLNTPLGIAISPVDGNLYVGSDGQDNIQIYSTDGYLIGTFADVLVSRPADLDFDSDGNLYLLDADAGVVRVISASGESLLAFGSDWLTLPITLAVADVGNGEEVFVGDMAAGSVQVFSTGGAHDRSLGERAGQFGSIEGRFTRIQGLAVDVELGTVHIADTYQNQIQVLDAISGKFLRSYGEYGTEVVALSLPLDVYIKRNREVIVANAGHHTVELVYVLQ